MTKKNTLLGNIAVIFVAKQKKSVKIAIRKLNDMRVIDGSVQVSSDPVWIFRTLVKLA